MPCESTRTVPPTEETVPVLTVLPEEAVVVLVAELAGADEAEPLVELEELLPHALSTSDAASAGRRNFNE